MRNGFLRCLRLVFFIFLLLVILLFIVVLPEWLLTLGNQAQSSAPRYSYIQGPANNRKGAILVTGGMGNIGSVLVRRLLQQGVTVISLDSAPIPFIPEDPHLNSHLDVVQGDVQNKSLLQQIITTHAVRGVFHLAAVTQDESCSSAVAHCQSVNVDGTKAVLQALAESFHSSNSSYPPWFVLISSLQTQEIQNKKSVIATKRNAEEELRKFELSEGGGHVDTMILRLGTVFGFTDWTRSRQRLISRLVRNAINGVPLFYFIDPSNKAMNRISLIHIDDVMSAFDCARAFLESDDRIFSKKDKEEDSVFSSLKGLGNTEASSTTELDIYGADVISIRSLISQIINKTNSISKAVSLNGKYPWEPKAVEVDNEVTESDLTAMWKARERTNKMIGFHPKINFNQGLDMYISALKTDTLAFLKAAKIIYCETTAQLISTPNTSHTITSTLTNKADEELIGNSPTFRRMRERNRFLLKRSWHFGKKCGRGFEHWSYDLIREMLRPTCRYNAHLTRSNTTFCQELSLAVDFAETGKPDLQTRALQACGFIPSQNYRLSEWDLPVCEFDCNHPTICIRTGRCKCIDLHRCEMESPNPPLSVTLQDPPNDNLNPLMTWVGRHLPIVHPKIHVIYRNSSVIKEQCTSFGDQKICHGVTERMFQAIASMKVPINGADMHMIPFYSPCEEEINGIFRHLLAELPAEPKSVGFVMAHDWGKCMKFYWFPKDMRIVGQDRPELPIATPNTKYPTFVFEANGDSFANCFNPLADVVIPPESCGAPDLVNVQSHSLKPIKDRTIEFLSMGAYMGTGEPLRVRLQECPKLYYKDHLEGTGLLHPPYEPEVDPWRDRGLWAKLGGRAGMQEYISVLNNTKFCLVPHGVVGWTFRFGEAIIVGCIPVVISDYTVLPFADLIDFTKFVIFVKEYELPILQDILREIPLATLEGMQRALKMMRTAFTHVRNPTVSLHSPYDLALREMHLQMIRGDWAT